MGQDNQPLIGQPQYASYQQQPQYGYAQQTVVVTEDHHHSHHHKDSHHTTPAIVLFIVGFFFPICWLISLIYIRSHNKTARSLSIASICLFVALIILVIIVSVSTH